MSSSEQYKCRKIYCNRLTSISAPLTQLYGVRTTPRSFTAGVGNLFWLQAGTTYPTSEVGRQVHGEHTHSWSLPLLTASKAPVHVPGLIVPWATGCRFLQPSPDTSTLAAGKFTGKFCTYLHQDTANSNGTHLLTYLKWDDFSQDLSSEGLKACLSGICCKYQDLLWCPWPKILSYSIGHGFPSQRFLHPSVDVCIFCEVFPSPSGW